MFPMLVFLPSVQIKKITCLIFICTLAACGSSGGGSGQVSSGSSSSSSSSSSGVGTSSGGVTPVAVPASLNAFEYEASWDLDNANLGGCSDGPVDTRTSTDTAGAACVVTDTQPGEWTTYLVTVSATGLFDFALRVATDQSAAALKLQLNGRTLGMVSVSGINRDTWQTAELKAIELPQGQHQLRVIWMNGGVDLNTINLSAHQSFGETSNLWGISGEVHDPSGFLSDWSYAGYRAGEEEPPVMMPTMSITDFGAIADDQVDDSDAFKAALAAAQAGDVVSVPAGRFILSEELTLPSGVVLQGAGSHLTSLYIPLALTDLPGMSDFNPSFNGGFINMKGAHRTVAKLQTLPKHNAGAAVKSAHRT